MSSGGDGRQKSQNTQKVPGREPLDRPLPKRFYAVVTVEAHKGHHRILLDGRGAMTPRKRDLAVPSAPLAHAIAAEWIAQVAFINPVTMPLTTLVCTTLDAVAGRQADVAADIVAYCGSDLVCYRAAGPAGLVAAQDRQWNPVLAWAQRDLGADFVATPGILHVPQATAAVAAVARALSGLDPFTLAATHVLTTLTGSALLALAVLRGHLTLAAAWAAAHVDEDWQIAQWGADEAASRRRARRRIEAEAAATVIADLAT